MGGLMDRWVGGWVIWWVRGRPIHVFTIGIKHNACFSFHSTFSSFRCVLSNNQNHLIITIVTDKMSVIKFGLLL